MYWHHPYRYLSIPRIAIESDSGGSLDTVIVPKIAQCAPSERVPSNFSIRIDTVVAIALNKYTDSYIWVPGQMSFKTERRMRGGTELAAKNDQLPLRHIDELRNDLRRVLMIWVGEDSSRRELYVWVGQITLLVFLGAIKDRVDCVLVIGHGNQVKKYGGWEGPAEPRIVVRFDRHATVSIVRGNRASTGLHRRTVIFVSHISAQLPNSHNTCRSQFRQTVGPRELVHSVLLILMEPCRSSTLVRRE